MPNISLDFFYDIDFANITITRSQGAPKVKPAWKVKQAPKLPPKPKALPPGSTPRPTPRPKINASRFPTATEAEEPRITELSDSEEDPKPTKAASKKNIPKLGQPKAKVSSPTAAKSPDAKTPKTPKTPKAAEDASKPQINGA
jgi:hypothetical protein